jgi:hypothetical protein
MPWGHLGQGGTSSSEAAVNDAVLQSRALAEGMEAEEKAKPEPEGHSKPNAETFLSSFTEADVVRPLNTGSDDPRCEWPIATRGPRKSTLVALSYERGELGGRPEALKPRLFVLERRGDKLVLVRQGKPAFTLDLPYTSDGHGITCRNDRSGPGTARRGEASHGLRRVTDRQLQQRKDQREQ